MAVNTECKCQCETSHFRKKHNVKLLTEHRMYIIMSHLERFLHN